MSTTNILYSDNDSDSDDANDDSVTQPLLLPSSVSSTPTSTTANGSTTTIKLPTSTVVPINKSNSSKHPHHNRNNSNENRVCAKLTHFMTARFNRIDNNRRSPRDKWSRINIGLFTISFVSVIYLCVSLNLSVDADSKPSPQIIVDVPPIDPESLGTKGKFQFNLRRERRTKTQHDMSFVVLII